MSLNDIIAIAGNGVPGLGAAVTIVNVIYTRVSDVKVYRQQCRDLASRCCSLLVAIQESSKNTDHAQAREMADEVEATVTRIRCRVEEWAAYSRVKSLLNVNEIKDGIDSFYKDIDSCFKKFNLQIGMELAKGQRELAAIQESDRAELREMLQNIATSVDELRAIQRPQSFATMEVMENIEEELDDPTLEASQQADLQRGLSQIRQNGRILPPMMNLTGQVVKVSELPVLRGRLNDIYIGKWIDGKKVALRLPRDLMNTPASQMKFEKEVEIWRRLQHPNITRLYGVAYFENHAYMVSHWMEHGNAIAYVQNYPDVDRLRLIDEIASGMEYLHSCNIVHGSVCGVNVLISKRGKACLSDFGFSKVLEEFGQETSAIPGTSNTRWNAPELLEPVDILGRSKVSTSMPTDVWSFGMLSLELMTGRQPFSEVISDDAVAVQLTNGKLPPHPGSAAASQGLTDGLWALMLRCWNKRPDSRPSMTQIKAEINRLREDFTPLPSSVSSGCTTSPAQIHDELVPDSPARSTLPKRKGSHASSSGSSFTGSQTRRPSSSSGVLGRIKALRRSSSQQCDDFTQITPVTPLSPTLPDIPIPTSRGFFSDVQNSCSEIPVSPGYPSSTTPLGKRPLALSVATSVTPASTESTPIRRSKDGLIEAATLEDLIEQLITASDLKNAAVYRDIFLVTYDAFTTSSDVFQALVHRFHNTTSLGQERTHLRINIIAVMKYWVTRPHIKVGIDVLSQIKDFAGSLARSEQAAKKMIELGEDLLLVTAERIQLFSGSASSSRLLFSPTIVEPSPEELAIVLTILEGDIFARIFPTDCILHLHQSQANDNVNAVSHTNKKIFNWVQNSILNTEDLEIRGEVLKFFVYTAEKCRDLRNFASMSAIVNALQSATIISLGLTYDELPTDAKRKLKKMSDLLKPDRNHGAYKENLKRCKNEPRIPWLAVHMHDMEVVFLAQDTIEVGGIPLIDFAKWTRLYDCMRDVFPHKPPNVSGYRQSKAGALAYLEQQLLAISAAPGFDEVLKTQSRKLVEAEDVQRTLGIPRLRAVGIR